MGFAAIFLLTQTERGGKSHLRQCQTRRFQFQFPRDQMHAKCKLRLDPAASAITER